MGWCYNMTNTELKAYGDFSNKIYEKMSMREVVNKFETAMSEIGGSKTDTLRNATNKINAELYAYKDSNDRWRAGRLAKQNTGQYISKQSAGSLRGNAIKQIEKLDIALRAMKKSSSDLSVNESISKSFELTKKYRENIKLNPNAKKSVVYGNTINDVFGNDWTES